MASLTYHWQVHISVFNDISWMKRITLVKHIIPHATMRWNQETTICSAAMHIHNNQQISFYNINSSLLWNLDPWGFFMLWEQLWWCVFLCVCLRRVFLDCLINPLQEQMEEWKRVSNTLDKDHAKGRKTQTDTMHLVMCVHRLGVVSEPHYLYIYVNIWHISFVIFVFLHRVQEGPSGDQEEIVWHSEAAEES